MKKKISILSLIIVFFVSITSLPVSIYFCHMTNTYSMDKCPMVMQTEMSNGGTCTSEAVDNIQGIRITSNCCTVKTVDSPIKDYYLSSNNNFSGNVQLLAVTALPVLHNHLNVTDSFNQNYFDISPPLLSSNSLYLTNSTLLI